MKKIVNGDLLKEKIIEGINLLCDTVKTTLGPKGSNIIIDHSLFSPFITNDGVTIAENIESEDEIINTILTLTKESSIKTNESVGDGTTTTLVLLQSIYNKGIKRINEGMNPILLKKELNNQLEIIINLIKKESKKPTKKNLKSIAQVSGNSDLIANIVSEAYQNVSNKESINIIETDNNLTYLEILKGYIFETLIASPYFFKHSSNIIYKNPQLLLINNTLDEIYTVENILNQSINKDIPLIIIANDYSDLFINEMLSLYFDHKIKITLLKIPEYGIRKNIIYDDLKAISNAKIMQNTDNILLNDLGNIEQIKIDNNETIINFKPNENTEKIINEINSDNEFDNKRLSMFSSSTTNIYVGANTNLERRELKMRFDDAIWATNEAKKGIVPGSGITFYKISELLPNDNLFKDILKAPLNQILLNSGLQPNTIINELKKHNFKKLYNVISNIYEDTESTNILDPTSVLINSLTNASSIASMLLTTTSLIINEHKNTLTSSNFTEM